MFKRANYSEDQELARADRFEDRAIEAFEAGFKTKAARKDALADIASAYRVIVQLLRDDILRIDRERGHDLYWDIPEIHHFKPRHAAAIWDFGLGKYADRMSVLKDLRDAVTSAEIKPVVKDDRIEQRAVRIGEDIEARMARLEKTYLSIVETVEIFGGAEGISVSAHYVTNEHGTTFLRRFYYVFGKLTPLNVIVAGLEEGLRRREETDG